MKLLPYLIAAILLLGAASRGMAQSVRVGGSSSLGPGLERVASELRGRQPATAIDVRATGTANGLELLCRGAVEIAGASRPASAAELKACEERGVEFVAFPVALDAVVVAVNPQNDWAQCLTLDELRLLWGADSGVEQWSDLREEWPAEAIVFHAPGVASGTYDFWSERVLAGRPMRTDFFPSEDDRQLVQAVAEERNATSFFGVAHLERGGGAVRAVSVADSIGCMDPASLRDPRASRWPFLRPLYLYVSLSALENEPALTAYVQLLLSEWGSEVLQSEGYLALDERVRRAALERFLARASGPLPAGLSGDAVVRPLPGG